LKKFVAIVLLLVASARASTAAGLPEDKALIDAAFDLDLRAVRAALAKGANPNAKKFIRSPLGMTLTPVLLSAVVGQSKKDRWLLAGSSEDEWAGVGQSIDETRTAIAKSLFDAGATLVRLGDVSRSILWSTSIRMGNVGLIALLVDHGASVTKKVIPEDLTPTELALMESQQGAYELLISRGGAAVDNASSAQFALLAAAERSDVAAMEQAIGGGANINGLIGDHTALMVALGEDVYTEAQVTAIRWLLDHGADPNVGSRFDLPLHRFVFSCSYTLNNLGTLREQDFRATRQLTGREFDAQRVRALNREILIRLLKAGAKVSAMNNYGWTPLHYAARFDNLMAAEILIMEGAKISERDGNFKAPLDYAQSAAMIKLLTSNGAAAQ
jgi:ankyrin repeat protein